MSWVKLDDQFADHPKVLAAGPAAAWLYVCGLTYCARYLTDGFIPAAAVPKLAAIDDAAQYADRLVEVGLWSVTDGGYQVHDYLDYNPSAAQVKAEREAARQRMAKARSPEVQANNAGSSSSPSPYPYPYPYPYPQPVPVPDHENGRGANAAASPEESPAKRSRVKRTKGVDLAPLIAAFEAHNQIMPPLVMGEDKWAGELQTKYGADATARCWQDIGDGLWPTDQRGREIMQANRSFKLLASKMHNWAEWDAKGRRCGNGSSGSSDGTSALAKYSQPTA